MKDTSKRLTAAAISRIKRPKKGRAVHWDSLVRGFGLQITDKDARTWLLQGRINGKPVKLSFGRPGDRTVGRVFSLTDARNKAAELKAQIEQGIDPRTTAEWQGLRQPSREPDSEHAAGSFGALVDEYRDKHLKVNTRRWRDHDRNIRHYLAPWLDRPYRSITAAELMDVTDTLLAAGKPGAANDAHRLANRVINWAVARRKLDASPLAGLKRPAKEKARDRVLDEDEIRALWTTDLGVIASGFVKCLLITGQRRDSVAGMKWSEIEGNEWRIPGERMKNGDEHTVPLPDMALDILASQPRFNGDFVFSTTSGARPVSGFSKIKRRIDSIVEIDHWTFHDLRRTMTTEMARIGITQHVVEKLLDHRGGVISGIASVYNRHEYRDEMRHAVDAWASRLNEIVTGEPMPSNVVELQHA